MDWHSHLLLLRILPQQITLYLCFLFIEVCLCGRFLEVGLLGQRANKCVVSSDKAKFSSSGAAPFSPPTSNIGEGCFSIALPMECLLKFCQLHWGKYLRRAALFSLMGVAELVHHQEFPWGTWKEAGSNLTPPWRCWERSAQWAPPPPPPRTAQSNLSLASNEEQNCKFILGSLYSASVGRESVSLPGPLLAPTCFSAN